MSEMIWSTISTARWRDDDVQERLRAQLAAIAEHGSDVENDAPANLCGLWNYGVLLADGAKEHVEALIAAATAGDFDLRITTESHADCPGTVLVVRDGGTTERLPYSDGAGLVGRVEFDEALARHDGDPAAAFAELYARLSFVDDFGGGA